MALISELSDSDQASEDSRDSGYHRIITIQDDQETREIDNPIDVIVRYYLSGKGNSSLKLELLKQSGLFFTSILGVMFYYEPAEKYAESICADPAYKGINCSFFVGSHVTGTLLVAGGVLMIATNSFIDQHNASCIPIELADYLKNPLTRKQRIIENSVTAVGSFIASIPFVIITVLNPIPGLPKFLIFSQACIVGVTNTLLHLLPFKLALKNKLYRAPFLPIEFFYQKMSNFFLSSKEKQAKKLHDQISQSEEMIKQVLIDRLGQGKNFLSINGFKLACCSYANEAANKVFCTEEQNHPPLKKLIQSLNSLDNRPPDRHFFSSGSINNFFRKIVYLLGASWVILACAGFWGGTFNEMAKLTGDNPVLGAVVSAPSIYFFAVLLAFFGGNALENFYHYLTEWKDDTVKIPMVFKLYPKMSVLLIFISMYLSAFSYAAGAQLTNDNFNDKLEFLRPYLLALAKTGLTFLGFSAMIDFFNAVLSKFGQYVGGEKTRRIIQFFESLTQIQNAVKLMDPSLLLKSLAQMDKNQLKNLFKINEHNQEKFGENLTQLAENLKTKIIFNFESTDPKLVKLLLELKNDRIYAANKIGALLDYLSNSNVNLGDGQDYKNVCEIMKTLEILSNKNTANNYQNHAGPSNPTENTPLLFPRTAGRGGSSVATALLFPMKREEPLERHRNDDLLIPRVNV
jgi:hypothetical protein